MKADFEPWWMFDGWEEEVISRHSFLHELEAKEFLNGILLGLREKFSNESVKKECFFAFWSDDEKIYCEACSDDSQIFHGVILLCDGKPFV